MALTYAVNDVVKLKCEDTISVEVNDTGQISETDANISDNLRTGFNEWSSAGSHATIDDFEAADLVAPPATTKSRLMLLGVG